MLLDKKEGQKLRTDDPKVIFNKKLLLFYWIGLFLLLISESFL